MSQKKISIEVCVEGIGSALTAFKAGASRIELCDNLLQGGTTPSSGTLRALRKKTDKDIFVLIRPRAGDFLYSNDEFEVLCEDIRIAKSEGANGIVSGALMADGRIDKVKTARMIEEAHPLPFTFHRAFDVCRDPFEAMEDLIVLGVARILTSGQKPTAQEGLSCLKALIEKSNGRIIILPGSGIRAKNILQIMHQSGAHEFHVSERSIRQSKMLYRDSSIPMSSIPVTHSDEYSIREADFEKLRELISRSLLQE